MADDSEIKTLVMRAREEGYDAVITRLKELADEQIRVGEAVRASQTIQDNASKAQQSYARAFDRQTLQYDATAKASAQYARELKILQANLAQGTISAETYASRLGLLETHFRSLMRTEQEQAAAAGFNRIQMMESVHVIKSLVDSVIAGQSPMRAFAMEGGRIGQIFTEGQGGVGQQLKGFAGQIGGLVAGLGPLVLGTTALVAVGIGLGVVLAEEASIAQRVENSLLGVGRAAGLTGGQLMALASAGAAQAHISESAARTQAEAYARTGAIGGEVMARLIALSKDYAVTSGTDLKKAGEELAKAFADPAKGAEELNAKLGFLDDATKHHIETLTAQNDRLGAQRVLLDAMGPSLSTAADHVTFLASVWEKAGTAAANALFAMGNGIDRLTREATAVEHLQDLLQQRKIAANPSAAYGGFVGTGNLDDAARKRVADIDAEIAAYQRQIAAEKGVVAAQQQVEESKRNSVLAGDIARSSTPGLKEFQTDVNNLVVLEKELADPMAKSRSDFALLTQSVEAHRNAVVSLLAPGVKLEDVISGQTHAIQAYLSPAQRKAEIDQLQAKIERDRNNPAALKRDNALLAEYNLRGKLLNNLDREFELKSAIAKSDAHVDAKQAVDTAPIFASFDKQTQDIRDQTKSIGQPPEVLALAKAYDDLTAAVQRELAAKHQSIDLSPEMIAKIRAEAAARAEAVKQQEAARKSLEAINSAEHFFAQQGFDMFMGVINGTKSWRQELGNLLMALEKAVLEAELLGSGPLAGLFGTAGQNGAVGGIFGGLFKMFVPSVGTSSATMGGGAAGAFADGGPIPAGQWGIAGEKGPEIITGPAHVYNAAQMKALAGGGGAQTVHHHVTVTISGATGSAEIRQAVQQGVGAALSEYDRALPGRINDIQYRGL